MQKDIYEFKEHCERLAKDFTRIYYDNSELSFYEGALQYMKMAYTSGYEDGVLDAKGAQVVGMYLDKGRKKLVRTFESAVLAADVHGVSYSTLTQAIRKCYCCNGYYFKYK